MARLVAVETVAARPHRVHGDTVTHLRQVYLDEKSQQAQRQAVKDPQVPKKKLFNIFSFIVLNILIHHS